jgi:hypothetical protein
MTTASLIKPCRSKNRFNWEYVCCPPTALELDSEGGPHMGASHVRSTTVLYPLAPLHSPSTHSRVQDTRILAEIDFSEKNPGSGSLPRQERIGRSDELSRRRWRWWRRRTQSDGLARTKRRQGVMRSARDRTVQATEPVAFFTFGHHAAGRRFLFSWIKRVRLNFYKLANQPLLQWAITAPSSDIVQILPSTTIEFVVVAQPHS